MNEEKRIAVNKYERGMRDKLLILANDISKLGKIYEQVEAEKSILKSNESETNSKKWEQISELSQVIAAIDMIENLCSRKDQPHIHTTTLPYATNPIKQNFSESLGDCE